MREADCKNLSEKPEGVFRQSQMPRTESAGHGKNRAYTIAAVMMAIL